MAENTNVFISDLPADMDDNKLSEIFAQYGTVTWSRVMPNKGKPSQAAIVEFATVDEAKWVVENLNGNVAQGLTEPIQVAFKRERSKGYGKGKDDGGYGKSGGGYGKSGGKSYGGYSSGGKGKGYTPYEGGKSWDSGKSSGGKWGKGGKSW